MSCSIVEMDFFPVSNFLLQTPNDSNHQQEDDHHHHQHHSINQILPSCSPQDFQGASLGSYTGKRSMSSFSDMFHHHHHQQQQQQQLQEESNDIDELSDDGSQAGEKKRRLSMEQVKTLEKNFELGNKLEPERKMQLARTLGLQPRQIAIWFQNRRARWKTKQLEKDYDLLKRQFDAIKADNDALQAQNHKLRAQIIALKGREPTESINLNKETEGSCSNRSENSSDDIKLDISRTPPATDSPISTPPPSRSLFPTTSSAAAPTTNSTHANMAQQQPFQNSPSSSSRPDYIQSHKSNINHQSVVNKDESLCNMFSGIEDQTGFWPWLEQHHFN